SPSEIGPPVKIVVVAPCCGVAEATFSATSPRKLPTKTAAAISFSLLMAISIKGMFRSILPLLMNCTAGRERDRRDYFSRGCDVAVAGAVDVVAGLVLGMPNSSAA